MLLGPPNGESNYDEAIEFDPIKHHNYFCPWVNGNVAAAGCGSSSGSSSTAGSLALCGWQLTLDALDAFQAQGHIPVQMVESESAASMYKVCEYPRCGLLAVAHLFIQPVKNSRNYKSISQMIGCGNRNLQTPYSSGVSLFMLFTSRSSFACANDSIF